MSNTQEEEKSNSCSDIDVDVDDISETRIETLDSFEEVYDISKKPVKYLKARTRDRLALFILFFFFLSLSLPFFYLIHMTNLTNGDISVLEIVYTQVIDMIKTIAAILGGIMGAVITYYFTQQKE